MVGRPEGLFSMIPARLDFETRSEADLPAVGAWEYSLHPTTEVLCFAWKVADEETQSAFVTDSIDYLVDWDISPEFPYEMRGERTIYEAHNAGFEYAIWTNIMCRRYGWPILRPERIFCSAAKAAAHGLPRSLDGAARAMGLPIEKDKKGYALMMKLCKPRPQWKKIGKGDKYFGTPEEFQKLKSYCETDVDVEYALSKQLRPLSETERKIFLLDMKINRRGVHCDKPLVDRAIELSKAEQSKGNAIIAELTGGSIQTTNQRDKLLQYLKDYCFLDMPNMQAETVEATLKTTLFPKAEKILKIRQTHSKSSVMKYAAMHHRMGPDDRCRETLLYHGAHTGRWTGKALQPHNYPVPKLSREEIEHLLIPNIMAGRIDLLTMYRGSVPHALSDTLRSCFTAAPGHVLIGADYSSIEARVLFWLAGVERALDMFRRGEDIYIDMASTIYNLPLDEITKSQRGIGKRTVLGCGYQMGPTRFEAECLKRDVALPEGMAKVIIDSYRGKYPEVKALWYDVHDTSLKALSAKATTTKGRPLTFGRRGPFLLFQLPSGRMLHYKDPEIRFNQFHKRALSHMHVHPKKKIWVRTTTYGGALVENIVQAIARDIMARAMLRAEAAGYRIIFTVHDELVAEVPIGFGSVEEFENLLCDTEDWAEGCPIAAEGWTGERFGKR